MSTACSVNVDMIGIFKSSFDMLKYLPVLSYRAGVALFSLVSREQLAFFTLFLRKNVDTRHVAIYANIKLKKE